MSRGGAPPTSSVVARDVGKFVRVPDIGLGRLTGISSGRARYFKGPGRSPYVDYEHVVNDVVVARLAPHTRVYLHDGQRWRIGRIDEDRPQEEGNYLVAFPNREGAIQARS